MSLEKEIRERLEWYDGGDGVEFELWIDPETEIIYEVPLYIKRDFKNSEKSVIQKKYEREA